MGVRRSQDRSGVPVVLLDRPERLNALNMEVIEGIAEALHSAGPCLVLGSTDSRSFSSGADLTLADPERAALSDALYRLYMEMRRSDTVIVAAANGHALGGGAQLLIACDIRVVGPDTTIRFIGAGHGLVVGAWGLPSLVGRGRATELCLSTRPVGADEALRIGLVDRVASDPLEEALTLASSLLHLDPAAVVGVKRIVSIPDPIAALEHERELNSEWSGFVPRRGDS